MGDFSRLQEAFSQVTQPVPKTRDSTVLIIDGMNTFIRVFSAVPTLNDNGEHVGGVAGFLKSIASNVRQFAATRCIVVFDGVGGSHRRRKLFKDYKGSRKNAMTFNRFEEFNTLEEEKASMKRQFVRIGEYLEVLPITTVMLDNIEADDSIAFMIQQHFSKASEEVIIVSTDRDYLQLVNDKVKVWSPIKRKLYDKAEVQAEFGIPAENYLTYRVLTGDVSDNIPGVKGLQLKTMKKIFPQITEEKVALHDLIEYSYQGSQNKSHKKAYESVLSAREQLDINYQLMQLHEVDISAFAQNRILALVQGDCPTLDRLAFRQLASQDGLTNYVKDLEFWMREGFNILSTYANIK